MLHVRKRKHPNGAIFYQACWHIIVEGKRKQFTKAFAKAAEAKAHATRMADEAEGRGIHDPNRYTVRSYINRWLAQTEERGEHSLTTLVGYRRNAAFSLPPRRRHRSFEADGTRSRYRLQCIAGTRWEGKGWFGSVPAAGSQNGPSYSSLRAYGVQTGRQVATARL